MAISGPILTGLAALGSAFVGSSGTYGVWGVMAGVICGALASVVNTLEHGGQVGWWLKCIEAMLVSSGSCKRL
ncbi:putative F-box protein [Prunus yedoensis var. nudiflora]|uniref:Putative F-box protein n=1 Tax=Prunus yedoensis var. nudiflora TaxID=2094558 RepID=A0A314Y4J3_PRUYE|nr:putative F-box protein [Prunus yedoensis var. nudiflora]